MTSKFWASVIRLQLSWPVKRWGRKSVLTLWGHGFIALGVCLYFIQLSEIKCMFITPMACEELEYKGENGPWTFLSSSRSSGRGEQVKYGNSFGVFGDLRYIHTKCQGNTRRNAWPSWESEWVGSGQELPREDMPGSKSWKMSRS